MPLIVKMGIFNYSQVGLGLISIFLIILSSISVFGYIYDKYLKMWIPMNIVSIERNIYARTKQTAKEIVQWKYYLIPLLKANNRKKEAEFFNKWIEKCQDEDPQLKKDVDFIIEWVNEYEPNIDNEIWFEKINFNSMKNSNNIECNYINKELKSVNP